MHMNMQIIYYKTVVCLLQVGMTINMNTLKMKLYIWTNYKACNY